LYNLLIVVDFPLLLTPFKTIIFFIV
jgi:hypothetical protein